MPTVKQSDNEIAIRIVPQSFHWPQSGTTWTTARHGVDALKHLVRKVDIACTEAEEDRELSAGAIGHRRTEICEQALRKLVSFPAFETAEKALIANIESLERLSDPNGEQVRMLQTLKRALHDLREGIPATQRMLMERGKMRERVFG